MDTVCEPVAYIELLVVNDKARCDAFGSLSEMHAHTAAVAGVGGDDIRGRDWIPDEDAGRVGRPGGLVRRRPTRRDVFYLRVARRHRCDGYPTRAAATRVAVGVRIWRDVNLHTSAKNDVAHLFTGRDLKPNSVGGAYQYSACSDDSSYCGATNPEDPSETLRSGDCAFDSSVGASGATVCCNGRRGGAVSTVADPSNANTDATEYYATSLVFESALIVSHHLGKQLGMDIDGTELGELSSHEAHHGGPNRRRPIPTRGGGQVFLPRLAATLERQLPTYTCLFRETVGRSICGSGVVERERGESATAAAGTRTACARSLTARSSPTRTAARRRVFSSRRSSRTRRRRLPSPPPATYEPHAWCDAGAARLA